MPLLSRPTSTTSSPNALEPIRIATDDLELVGSVASTGQRITDLLLRGQDLAFLPAGADPTPDAWIAVAPSDILWVVPPPLPARRDWRPAADRVRLSAWIGAYRVTGAAHLSAGVRIGTDLARTHPFLPLTNASLARDGRAAPEDLPVVILNLGHARELHPVA